MEMTMAKKKHVYVYHDGDHGDIEVFDALEKAQKHTEIQWPCDDEEAAATRWDGDIDKWGYIHDQWSDYVTIHKQEIRTDMPKEEE